LAPARFPAQPVEAPSLRLQSLQLPAPSTTLVFAVSSAVVTSGRLCTQRRHFRRHPRTLLDFFAQAPVQAHSRAPVVFIGNLSGNFSRFEKSFTGMPNRFF